jgi:hypothetical protein
VTRKCNFCGSPYEAQRPTSKFCSSTCRGKNSRGDQAPASQPVQPEREVSGLVDSVRAELEVLDKIDTSTGQQALELATRLVSAPGMNNGVASLSKELSRVLGEARGSSTAMADPVDELKARRDAKLAG